MKFVVDCDIVLFRPPSGPIAAYIEPFAKSLREQGYARQSIHRQVFLSAAFSEWLARRQLVLHRLSSDLALQYLRYRFRHVQPSRGDAAALKHLLEFLRCEGAIPAEKIARTQQLPPNGGRADMKNISGRRVAFHKPRLSTMFRSSSVSSKSVSETARSSGLNYVRTTS